MSRMNTFLRRFYNFYHRLRLRNTDITLISSNCIGGRILSDLHLRFQSPFVNLGLNPQDYVKLCENLEYYLSCPVRFVSREGVSYPVGMLDDLQVNFAHYATEAEALELWNRRKQRMNWDNLYLLFTDRGGCTYTELQRFDQLRCPNKAVLCNREYPEIRSAVYIPGFESEASLGDVLQYKNRFTFRKYYDDFDYVSWFNGGASRQGNRCR